MKAVLCDIDGCRKDSDRTVPLQYFGTPSVFHQEGYSPESCVIIMRAHPSQNEQNLKSILQRNFDLCYDHIREVLDGSRIGQFWTTEKDHNVQDERFTITKMKRDRS